MLIPRRPGRRRVFGSIRCPRSSTTIALLLSFSSGLCKWKTTPQPDILSIFPITTFSETRRVRRYFDLLSVNIPIPPFNGRSKSRRASRLRKIHRDW